MKLKQLLILIVSAVLLGLVAYLLNSNHEENWNDNSTDEANALLLPETELDPTKVDSITLQSSAQTVTLYKKDGSWCVKERYDYPASLDGLREFLVALTDSRIARRLTLSPEQLAELKLTADTGITLTLADESGKTLQTLIIGSSHVSNQEDAAPKGMMMFSGTSSMPNGRFILKNDTPLLIAETLRTADVKPETWLDKDFFRISDLRKATLSANGQECWTLEWDEKTHAMAPKGDVPAGKELDASKVSSVQNAFSWLRFNDVAPANAQPADIGFDNPMTFTGTDKDGFTYTVQFGQPKDSKRYMKLISVQWNGETERKPAADEKPEDKQKLDTEFAAKVKANQDKAAKLNATIAKWTYDVGTHSLNPLDIAYGEFYKDAAPAQTDAEKQK